jgi:predicted membrane protein
MKKIHIRNLALTGLFMSIGLVLPFLTGQIPEIGNMLLPMHIPVFLCALICGWQYGLPMAFVLPLLRSLIFGMPPLYPTALSMAFELATYALVAGLLFWLAKKQNILTVYYSIIAAMIAGRLVWGAAQATFLGIGGKPFTFSAFLSGALLNAIPGIIIQLILIPAVLFALDRSGLVPFKRPGKPEEETTETEE